MRTEARKAHGTAHLIYTPGFFHESESYGYVNHLPHITHQSSQFGSSFARKET